MSKKYLTREQILGADDLGYDEIDLPEWGGVVRIKALSHAGYTELIANEEHLNAAYVAASVVDEKGDRIYTAADITAIEAKSPTAIKKIVDAVLRLNGRGSALESASKNSDPSASGGSSLH